MPAPIITGRNEPDSGPDADWTTWTDAGIEQMLADIGYRTARVTAAIAWHQHNKNDRIETIEQSRRIALDYIDDLRGLLNRDATR
ncbi:hypothetical protein [Bifidobacterium vansinderenii]|uniref:Uncharacterized protein n=1 Tax=Bifidobacterium vansinderenii TaxID=1984871 RepID=A0A229VWP9_9BIFI|nr:hypothetical protein [Bifidobacterium vansinderenii]OXN00049.1 hypothetical protein Tam10B_1684 [Bifidobacterium vansinderenii]